MPKSVVDELRDATSAVEDLVNDLDAANARIDELEQELADLQADYADLEGAE